MNAHSTILVVEDDQDIAEIIGLLLQDAGYRVVAVGTVAAAREQIERPDLDLVVLDWNLPDASGASLCAEIKHRQQPSFLPILMLTAYTATSYRVAALDAGADDFLSKPFNAEEFQARVRALLRIRAAELSRLHVIEELRDAYNNLATTQAQLMYTSRMAALGELVGGIAHEINNPLGIILGNAEIMSTPTNPEDELSLQQIIEGALRARRIVKSMLAFGQQDSGKHHWQKPSLLIEQVLDLKRISLHKSGIELHLDIMPDLPPVWADSPQFQQVLLNVLLNAEYALRDRQNPRIELRCFASQAPVAAPNLYHYPEVDQTSAFAGSMLVIDISDNGCGIAPQHITKLFQPFFTTKPVGEGSGLGLATAYGHIQQHHGSIQVASIPGEGTVFRIALPFRPDTF